MVGRVAGSHETRVRFSPGPLLRSLELRSAQHTTQRSALRSFSEVELLLQGSEPCIMKVVMPSRYYRRIFIKGYYYHIYNRGANKKVVFRDAQDYQVFTDILAYYLGFPAGKPLSVLNRLEEGEVPKDLKNKVPNLDKTTKASVELCAYCLMPNHFHLLLSQKQEPISENSVSNLMRRLSITFAMYSRKKYDRSGTLFEGKFKNVFVGSDSQFLQLSRYIHRNPLEIQGSEPLQNYDYSSYKFYIGREEVPDWLNTKPIQAFFPKLGTKTDYQKFVQQEPKPVEAEVIKTLMLE